MNAARRRALRAVLTALAGGGLTAAGLGAPLSPVALAAEGQPSTTTEGATTPAPAPPTETTPSEPPASTTPAPTSTTPAPTSTQPATTSTEAPLPPAPAAKPKEAPAVVLQRRQRTTGPSRPSAKPAPKTVTPTKPSAQAKPTGANNVALAPQVIAAQANALASTEASIQALGFYRIPLFLLPIYKAAAVQYGVPWQILAAINEIETNYGTDLSVSSAGAVGWMQFMPATWLQYGVDALNAGYADPYNPVDAIFAAARYLRAAGAANDLHAAILAYNHSEEYVSSVLLRAKLISAYPSSVIATLTGLVDGRLPVSGHQLAWGAPRSVASGSSTSATAGATALAPQASAGAGSTAGSTAGAGSAPAAQGGPGAGQGSTAATPGAVPAPAPTVAASTAPAPLQLVDLTSAPDANVVAVQNGRVVQLGASRRLGRFLVLRDVYGDIFTYAGLGSIAPSYARPKPATAQPRSPVIEVASHHDPAPSQAASAGFQSPLTLQVKKPARKPSGGGPVGQVTIPTVSGGGSLGSAGKVRLFAHPGNPDARAAAAASRTASTRQSHSPTRLPLRRGSVVTSGTVLGRVSAPSGGHAGHLRFAIRPAGDAGTIDPGPILANWAQLQGALHPRGAKAEDALLGATASDVFLLSGTELQRAVLSDPGIVLDACGRHDVAAGAVDKRVLAVLAFLSRSGLKPTVSALSCGQGPASASAASASRANVEISAINGTPIAGNQGVGTIVDVAIRTLLTLPGEFQPASIDSLMRYPGAPSTHASQAFADRIGLQFRATSTPVALAPSPAAAAGHAARRKLAVPVLGATSLSSQQWSQLIERVGSLPSPTVARKPSPAAIPDPRQPVH